MAAAEAIVVKEVSEEIPQPLYTLESPAGDELADVLNRLFNKNPRQEAILRSLLVVAHAPDEQIHETRIVNTVADNAGSQSSSPTAFQPNPERGIQKRA